MYNILTKYKSFSFDKKFASICVVQLEYRFMPASVMATVTSEDIEDTGDSLSASDIILRNAVPANRYTEEFDDIDGDELDNSQVARQRYMNASV